jgi:hypothetical protein
MTSVESSPCIASLTSTPKALDLFMSSRQGDGRPRDRSAHIHWLAVPSPRASTSQTSSYSPITATRRACRETVIRQSRCSTDSLYAYIVCSNEPRPCLRLSKLA